MPTDDELGLESEDELKIGLDLPDETLRLLHEAFTPAQIEALEAIRRVNARSLRKVRRAVLDLARMLNRWLALLFLLFFLSGGATVWVLERQLGTPGQIAHAAAGAALQAEQTSRFDASYRACERLNRANAKLSRLSTEFGAKFGPAAGQFAQQAFDLIAPLRDGKQGRPNCIQYSNEQVLVRVPPEAGAPAHAITK